LILIEFLFVSCYNYDDELMTLPQDYGAGTVDAFPSTVSLELHNKVDVAPYFACCINSENCHLYDLLRPRPMEVVSQAFHMDKCLYHLPREVFRWTDCRKYAKHACRHNKGISNCIPDTEAACDRRITGYLKYNN
jgi:hypothetical protein